MSDTNALGKMKSPDKVDDKIPLKQWQYILAYKNSQQ